MLRPPPDMTGDKICNILCPYVSCSFCITCLSYLGAEFHAKVCSCARLVTENLTFRGWQLFSSSSTQDQDAALSAHAWPDHASCVSPLPNVISVAHTNDYSKLSRIHQQIYLSQKFCLCGTGLIRWLTNSSLLQIPLGFKTGLRYWKMNKED